MATLAQLASRMTSATPATVAAAVGGGTTAAEITALIKLLTVMAVRPGEAVPLLSVAMNSATSPDTNLTAY